MDCYIYIAVSLLVFLLFIFIFTNCCGCSNEKFTAPGLTLTVPPSWFPQISAKKYREKDWQTKVYLDRYPFNDELTGKESDEIASTNRFWVQ